MLPHKQLPKTVEADKAASNSLPTDFFKSKRKGLPQERSNIPDDTITIQPRKKKKRGPVPRMKGPPISHPLAMVKDKQKRVNYGEGASKDNLEQAIIEWDKKFRLALAINGEERSMQFFAGVIKIPYNTFQKYSCSKEDNRQDTGKSAGRNSLLSTENQRFVADVLARRDRGNECSKKSEAIDLVQDLSPHPSRRQAGQSFARTLLPKHPTVLKSRTVKAQATTTRRSAITVEQQFHWVETYHKVLAVLQSRNTVTCRQTGKLFGKLIQHFVFGGDETCFQA